MKKTLCLTLAIDKAWEFFLSVWRCLTQAASEAADGKLQDKTCGEVMLHVPARREIRPIWNLHEKELLGF